MIGGKAHADPVINLGHQIVTNNDIIEKADVDAVKAWVASPDIMRVNPASFAEIMFGNRRIPLIEPE